MRSRIGNATPLLFVVLLVSVATNVCLFRAGGGQRAPQTPEAGVPSPEYVRSVAIGLGLSPRPDHTEGDIASDVKVAIREAPVAPREVLSEENIAQLAKLLSPEERKTLRKGHDFLKAMSGKRYLVLPED